jgi:hypothetical protein
MVISFSGSCLSSLGVFGVVLVTLVIAVWNFRGQNSLVSRKISNEFDWYITLIQIFDTALVFGNRTYLVVTLTYECFLRYVHSRENFWALGLLLCVDDHDVIDITRIIPLSGSRVSRKDSFVSSSCCSQAVSPPDTNPVCTSNSIPVLPNQSKPKRVLLSNQRFTSITQSYHVRMAKRSDSPNSLVNPRSPAGRRPLIICSPIQEARIGSEGT